MHDVHNASARGPGAALFLCAVASVALLAGHPGGAGSPALADVLRYEAAHQMSDAVVHGGFVLVLAIELICFAALAVRAGVTRTAVLAAMVLATIGTGLLTASMIVDGLITPALAARYAAAPAEKQEAARGLLVLIGATIGVLMPMGLAFLGAAAVAWGACLTPRPGTVRMVGVIGLAAGAAIAIAAGVSLCSGGPLMLMIALLSQAAWTLAAGVMLFHWRQAC